MKRALEWQNQYFPQFPSSCGERPGGSLSLNELCRPGEAALASLLSWQAERVPGMDLRAQAAFLVANLSYRLSLMLGSLYLKEATLPRIDPDLLCITLSQAPAIQPEPVEASRLRLHLCTEEGPTSPETTKEQMPAILSAQLEQSLTPLVERLLDDTRLARAAQWRLIADSLAMGFLQVGQALGQEDVAKREALAVVKREGSRLFNKQLDFISLPHTDISQNASGGQRSFVSRGGCCRYYTAEGGTLCPTCVLEPLDKQHENLRRLLTEQSSREQA